MGACVGACEKGWVGVGRAVEWRELLFWGGEGEMLVWGVWLDGWEVCGKGSGSCCGGDAQWREGLGLCVDYLFCDVM